MEDAMLAVVKNPAEAGVSLEDEWRHGI